MTLTDFTQWGKTHKAPSTELLLQAALLADIKIGPRTAAKLGCASRPPPPAGSWRGGWKRSQGRLGTSPPVGDTPPGEPALQGRGGVGHLTVTPVPDLGEAGRG